MSEVIFLPGARICGLNVAIADIGLVKGYICVAAGEQGLAYAETHRAHEAIAKCRRESTRENYPWPVPDTLFVHDAPGELRRLVDHFKSLKSPEEIIRDILSFDVDKP